MFFSGSATALDFGNQKHWCFDDLDKCPNGHTLSFWLQISYSTRKPPEFIFSSGALTPDKPGIQAYYQYNSPDDKHYLMVDYVKRSLVSNEVITRAFCRHWHVVHRIPTSVFVQVIIQWDANGTLDLFLNGQKVTTGSSIEASSCTVTRSNFYIGRRYDRIAYDDCSVIYLDEFKFFDRLLTTEQVRQLNNT